MSERLTDEDLNDLFLASKGMKRWRLAIEELRSLRARSLTPEEREALRHAAVLVNAADCGDVADEPLRQRALPVLARLIDEGKP